MRLLVAVLALAFVPAAAAGPAPTLGIDWNGPDSRLVWFEPTSMTVAPRPTLSLGSYVGSWSLSPDRGGLAIARQNSAFVKFVDVRRMRVLGTLELGIGGAAERLTWTKAGRVLATLSDPTGAVVVAVDPSRRAVVRRTVVGGRVAAADRSADGLVLLLQPLEGIGTARLAVVGADGTTRIVRLDEISIGSSYDPDPQALTRTGAQRLPGLAVDPAGRVAYVVDAGAFAVVRLDSLAVAYRSEPRRLAKAGGPYSFARWLGDGLVGVSGTEAGVRLVDVRDWTIRTVDPAASSFSALPRLLLVRSGDSIAAYGLDGAQRYSFSLPQNAWLNADDARFAVVCVRRVPVAVVELATGLQTRVGPRARCGDLLSARWSLS